MIKSFFFIIIIYLFIPFFLTFSSECRAQVLIKTNKKLHIQILPLASRDISYIKEGRCCFCGGVILPRDLYFSKGGEGCLKFFYVL
jgi:hypothetical protein